MPDRLPSGWPRFSGVLIEPAMARPLLTLLDPGIRRIKADGMRPDEQMCRLLDALEALAKTHRGEDPTTSRPAVRWIAAKVAAEQLNVSPQAVRDMAHDGRLPSRRDGRLLFVEEGAVMIKASYR